MSPAAFDTLAYARRLASAGVPQEQADAHAEALAAAVGRDLVTKTDLEQLTTKDDLHDLDRRLSSAIAGLNHRITDLERRLDAGLSSLETRLTMRMGALVVAALGAMTAIGRFL